MKKKAYVKATMKVVYLRSERHLLGTSNGDRYYVPDSKLLLNEMEAEEDL